MNCTLIAKEKCIGCQVCKNICPTSSIRMRCDFEGFWFPEINASTCTQCGKCLTSCPVSVPPSKEGKCLSCYVAYSNDPVIRANSSSGGIFLVIAYKIIDMGGVVFGAAYDDKYNVIYTGTDEKENLLRFSGSKYVQCNMKESYKSIEKYLKKDRLVLITGTPCYISAVKRYLGRDYSNLICMDIICHGVPSPGIWNHLLKTQYNLDKIKTIKFRDKTYGWVPEKVHIYLKNGRKKTEKNYMTGFLNNLFLRNACYHCSYKGIENRESDITLGDAWGIEQIAPRFDDGHGISCILIKSQQGQIIFEKIASAIHFKSANYQKIIANNKNFIVSPENKDRQSFYNELRKHNFNYVMRKYCKKYEK